MDKLIIEFEKFIIREYCTRLNINKKELQKNFNESIKNHFRFLCFKLNYFMRFVTLPIIKKNSMYEAVIVEFRELPHIEFLIRNAIYRLGSKWAFTIICGNINHKLIVDICKSISTDIKIIKLDYDNITQQEYSNLLTTKNFWKLINGEKILIYQEDSLIFKNNINDFTQYDFIGAPFLKEANDTPNCVGNGGLSLRTKNKMIEVIENHPLSELLLESSTIKYMKMVNLTEPPEDVYFSKNMQEYNIGDVADWNTAYNFSSESIFNENSFGGHQFWISTNKWKEHIKNIFGYKVYKPKSDIQKFLRFIKAPSQFDKTKIIPNAFDIDLYFFCKVNNYEYINDYSALIHASQVGLHGFIYHPKQLLNFFQNIIFYKFLNNIYVFYKNNISTIQNFTSKYIYNSNFDFLSDLIIKKKFDCLNDNYDILFLVFIGNEEIGVDLIKRIIKYKKIQSDFNISFCFTKNIVKSKVIKDLIKNNFDFYAIYFCKELGTDITPTILMYDNIIKTHKFKHIFKFHTKSVKEMYINLTEYLISMPLNELLENKREYCNCIGFEEYYINLMEDKYNNKLKNYNISKININNSFVAGTIFYTNDIVFNKVLDFVKKNNYKSYLLNNLYENNSINHTFSPIHFLERLFGSIKI